MNKKPEITGTIETDTPILPNVIAANVVASVNDFLNVQLPESLSDRLAGKAERLYKLNSDVRRHIRGSGNSGRDYLYSFMRHWLHGIIKSESPEVAARLPASFANGMPLPNQQPK